MTLTKMTITVPDELVQRAERLTRITHRAVADLVTDALELGLPSLEASLIGGPPMSMLSDEEVMALTQARMETQSSARLSALLDHQQAATLTPIEATELEVLMQIYEAGLLRQSEALAEAVRRGLRAPLSDEPLN